MTNAAPIHNGITHQWNWLEVIDRHDGAVERISLDDGNSAVSVTHAADRCGISTKEAWEILINGGHLTTFGFVRRLAE